MKNLILICCLLTASFSYGQVLNYAVGDVIDDFTVTDVDGVEHNLYEYTAAGKHVYLDFFFTTCPPCQATVGFFNEFYDKYGCNTGDIICIEINNGNDNNAAVAAYSATYGGTFNHSPAVSNEGGGPAVDANFGISAYPTYCMIGPDNKLKESDIWPVDDAATFEGTFYAGFSPQEKSCTVASGIADVLEFSTLNVYPNPSSDFIVLNTTDMNEQVQGYTITNLIGETVATNFQLSNSQNYTIALDQFSNGLYFVKVYGVEGRSSTVSFEVAK